MGVETRSIRNVAIAGHVSTGKTSLVEHTLALAGAIPKPETVENGKTVSDFTEEEISRGLSIHLSLSNLKWKEAKINLLDTPGSADFAGAVASAFRVANSALVLIGADTGVQIGTIRIWRHLDRLSKPRIIFVNKMEKEHSDFTRAYEDLKDKFKANLIPVAIPIGSAGNYRGIINLLDQKAYIRQSGGKVEPQEIPGDMLDTALEARTALIEAVAEGNDELMEKYLEEEQLTDDEIVAGLRHTVITNQCVPVFCGSALLDSGLGTLLDFLSIAAPSPEGAEYCEHGEDQDGAESVTVSAEGQASCIAFKTSIDQFSGKLSYIKIITGKLKSESELYNARNREKERIGKLYTCQGKKLEDVNELVAGDLGIITKLGSVETGDSLCTQDNPIIYRPIQFPQPVHSITISAAAKKDEDKLNQLLHRETLEDPTLRIVYNSETKETVFSTMGELHLGIILDKIKEKNKIEVETKIPKIAYRETLTKQSSAEYQHKKQTGGHGQYAKVCLEIKPIPRGKEFSFINAIRGGAISGGYIPGVEKGILEGMEAGVLAGYPIVDLEAKVVDGKEHSVDSSEMAFKLASKGALRAAFEKASPVLLEPVMNLEVFVDDQYLGDVLSDLSSRRGRVLGQEPIGGGIQVIKAQVPQAELLRYSIDLKSITSGTASFEMEFDHYQPISGKIADDVIKASKIEES